MTENKAAFWFGICGMPPAKKWGLLFLLFLIALAQSFRLEGLRSHPENAIDFRNIYIGAVLISSNQDPYDDNAIKSTWTLIQKRENLEQNIAPGLPTMALLYPPITLYAAWPFTLMNYANAVGLFKGILLLQLLIFPWLLARWFRTIGIAIGVIPLLLLLLAIKPTMNMVNVGQPSLLFINAILLAMCLVAEKRQIWYTHILLFFGMFKPTLGGIIGAFYLNNWSRILFAVLIIGLTFLAFLGTDNTAISNYQFQANGQLSAAYDPGAAEFPCTFEAMSNTQMDSVLALLHTTGKAALVIKAILLLLCAVFYFKRRGRDSYGFVWLLPLILASLVFTYHKYYDLILLLPFAINILVGKSRLGIALGLWLLLHLLVPYKILSVAGLPPHVADLLQFQNSIIPLVWIVALSFKPQVFRYQLI
jgi:hypothetical protein